MPHLPQSRGTNQMGVRLYNERLVLSIIRRHIELPKADIARATGLSPQTISIIINQLTRDGLLKRGNPTRGRIGQPSVPYSLNAGGAYAFGLKIGRRSTDLYLIDFSGSVLGFLHQTYRYPMPNQVRDFAREGVAKLLASLAPEQQSRISGLGIAAPYEMWTWAEEIGAPRVDIDSWRGIDIRAEIAEICVWPVYYSNDITAACAAEMLFGRGGGYADYLYVFVGSFVGGGLVLDGHLFPGRTQNAAAIGSMPAITRRPKGETRPVQLMNIASIYTLETALIAQGADAGILWQSPDDWGDIGPALNAWISEVSESLAYAIVAAIAVVDIGTIILDGAFPAAVRSRVIAETRAALERVNRQGLSPFELIEGTIGHAARALGGATIPLLANFSQDREVLFKDTT